MLIIGLTGSIATGKSETSKLFSLANVPVFDSDAEVHKIYADKSIIKLITKNFPDAVRDNVVDRQQLGKIVLAAPQDLKRLESLIHPLVRAQREKFISYWTEKNCSFVILDIPLLYETGEDKKVDYVVVVSAPKNIQYERALARPGMTIEKLTGIQARQIPDSEKRNRADFIIENSGSLEQLREQVGELVIKFHVLSGGQEK